MVGVAYVVMGEKHVSSWLVSLHTLRKHFDGPVAVFTDQRDLPHEAQVFHVGPSPRGRVGYTDKCRLFERTPFDSTIFLDTDTVITGSLDELIVPPEDDRLYLVQAGDWTAQSLNAQVRFSYAAERAVVHPNLAYARWRENKPYVNTGVFAFSRACPVGSQWLQLTETLNDVYVDELAANLLYPAWPHRILDDRFNCIPRFSKTTEDVRVHHYTSGWMGEKLATRWCAEVVELSDQRPDLRPFLPDVTFLRG